MPGLILASSSPRRHALLSAAGFQFAVAPPAVDETQRPDEPADQYAVRIACEKALRVAAEEAVTLGADTVVVHDGRALGKPRDSRQAVAMLEMLSGTTHQVMTGWALAEPGRIVSRGLVTTEVTFRVVTAREIVEYVASREPLDRAGAYAIQGGASSFVAELHGSYTNVVGLPMEAVADALREAGVDPDTDRHPGPYQKR